jgi:glutathione S-transferase
MYAPKNFSEARDYGVARYGMEVQRYLVVMMIIIIMLMMVEVSDNDEDSDDDDNNNNVVIPRLCSVLDKHLANRQYMIGNEYSIVDIAIFPYFNFLRKVQPSHLRQ